MRSLGVIMMLAALLGAGCSVLRTVDAGREPWVKAGGARPAGSSESLLMYFDYVHKLPTAELAREHEAVRHLFAAAHSDFLRIRYAMVLSVPGSAFNDEARALELLEPVLKNPGGDLYALAGMLSSQIQEQRRAQGMQQKLEALKSLEKNLIERDPGTMRRR